MSTRIHWKIDDKTACGRPIRWNRAYYLTDLHIISTASNYAWEQIGGSWGNFCKRCLNRALETNGLNRGDHEQADLWIKNNEREIK